MSKRGEFFAPIDPGPPPTMDFMFTNHNPGQSTPTPRDYLLGNLLEHSKRNHNHVKSNDVTSSYPPTPHGQALPRKLKPGPISRSELSSGSNAFKLRVEDAPSIQKSTSSTRLRKEVFKKPHTLAPLPQSLDMVAIGRLAPVPGPLTSGDTVLKASNTPATHGRVGGSRESSSPSPFLNSEGLIFPDAIRTPGGITPGQRRRSNVHGKLGLPSCSTTQYFVEEPGAHDLHSGGSLARTTLFSPATSDHYQNEPRYHTPTRGSVIPTTPPSERSTREDTSKIYDLRRKCELYEVAQKFDRDLIASQTQTIEELSNKKAQMEMKSRNLESKHAAGVKEVAQRADATMAKLVDLHERFSQTSASQIKELKQGLDNFRQEIRDSMNAVKPLLTGYDEMKNTLREIAEEHEQQILEHNDEKTRLQQTNDLLRDQLSVRTGNYTESLEREKELQTSLIALGESHANVAKALSTLHEQYAQANTKYTDSKLAENAATKQVGQLEETITDLKIDNARIRSLLTNNEQAFSRKLQALEEDKDSASISLEAALRELGASKNGEQVTHSQVQALRQDKDDLLQSTSILEHDLNLRTQSLEEAQARNQVLERQLNDEKRNLEEARAECGHIRGQLVEKDRATSAQIQDLKTALESHREHESSLMSEVATLNAFVSTLRERSKEAENVTLERRALEKTLLEKCVEVERVEAENGQLKSQVVKLELARDAFKEEIKQLRETGCVARERETAAQNELNELRQSLKEQHQVSEKARIGTARMEAEMDQMKAALDKEKDAHRTAEKQRETSLLSLNKLQTEQKSLLDKASVTEKRLRSSIDELQKLELQYTERGNELKRLRDNLSASNSTNATLEALVSDFRDSVQQARSQREKIEEQEGKLTALSNQVSGQKTELRLLEQQLVNADARLAESRADSDAHRAAAESARSSAAAIEVQLKRKEQDVEAILAELQSHPFSQIDAAADTSHTSLLQNKIAEQEITINGLKSQVLGLEKKSDTIVERYKGGKLTNPEKDLVGVITSGIVQEKNRTINNLKGDIKRKDNDIETQKTTNANLKESLAKQIKQTAELKAQLELNGAKDPAGWNSFNHNRMTIPSSPLSDLGWHAPDHDPPAPDSPAVQLAERPIRGTRGQEQPQQHSSSHLTRPNPQQLHGLASTTLESGNAADEIQEFEEPETPRDTRAAGHKRGAVSVEPVDDEDQEEHELERKRKTPAKAKKDNKVAGESSGTMGQSNKADGPSTGTKGKATKRRKV
ncbi:hypothetical protein B0J17DRAFT_184980 [Rhizoctonia solani]|nr:hypothetical protein B0J17DRAFT_184980 [Rhizoctonia solani]